MKSVGAERRGLRDLALLKGPRMYLEELDFSEYEPPETYHEAVNWPESEESERAINYELRAQKKNEAWTVMKKKEGLNIIASK